MANYFTDNLLHSKQAIELSCKEINTILVSYCSSIRKQIVNIFIIFSLLITKYFKLCSVTLKALIVLRLQTIKNTFQKMETKFLIDCYVLSNERTTEIAQFNVYLFALWRWG